MEIPLYLRPNYRDAGEALGYSQAEIALLTDFAERGYVTISVDRDDFGKLAENIIADVAPDYGPDGRVQDAWKRHAAVRKLALDESVLKILAKLYGRKAFAFQTLNFNKGTEQETHSDTIHFDSIPHGFMAGVWVALENIDADNGPLHYYPGSHKLPHMTLADAGVRGSAMLKDAYVAHYEPMMAEFIRRNGLEREEGHIRRGEAIIWSANLLHGGSPIRQAGRTRHSQVTHYYFEDCAYYTPLFSDPLLGRTFYREPFDIASGNNRRGQYAGGAAPRASKPNIANRTKSWIARHILRR